MTTRIGDETRARIAAVWPALMSALETGEPFGPILDAAGLSRGQVRCYRIEDKARDTEWQVAREFGADAYADKVDEIANNPGADANIARVRIQAYQWLASKRNPRVYSEKQTIDMNVKTVDLTRIIQDANARLIASRAPRTIDHDTGQVVEPEPCTLADLL